MSRLSRNIGFLSAGQKRLEEGLSYVGERQQKEQPKKPTLPMQERQAAVAPRFGFGDHKTLNVFRAISLLKTYGYEAWPVSFDEAVELRLVRLEVKGCKAVEVPYFKILRVRHGLSSVRHFLDEQRDQHATSFAAATVVKGETETTDA